MTHTERRERYKHLLGLTRGLETSDQYCFASKRSDCTPYEQDTHEDEKSKHIQTQKLITTIDKLEF